MKIENLKKTNDIMNDRVNSYLKNGNTITPSIEIKLSDSDVKNYNSTNSFIDMEIYATG